MMKRTIVLFTIVGLAACDRSTAPITAVKSAAAAIQHDAAGDGAQSETMDISGTIVSPCTGEAIAYQGSAHLVVNVDQTIAGEEVTTHFNTQNLSGVGLVTGTKYQISDAFREDETTQLLSATGSADVAEHLRVISADSLDNFLVDLVYTITFPPLQFTYQTKNRVCEGSGSTS